VGVGFSPIFLVTVAVILPSAATTTLMVAESVASAVSFAVIVASPAALEVITIADLSASLDATVAFAGSLLSTAVVFAPRVAASLAISLVTDVNDDEVEPSPPSLQEVKNTPPLKPMPTVRPSARS
jgi:hypothetical protein